MVTTATSSWIAYSTSSGMLEIHYGIAESAGVVTYCRPAALEECDIYARNELNAGNHQREQAAVVGEEVIDIGARRAGQVDSISRRNSMSVANPGIVVRGFSREWQEFHIRRPQECTNLTGHFKRAFPVWAHQDLGHREHAGAKGVAAFPHAAENPIHSGGIVGMILDPVHEKHRVPIDRLIGACAIGRIGCVPAG